MEMIEGVRVKKLKVNIDSRGRLMEILRSDDEIFKEFGQVYMTTAHPGIVKAWHYHKLQDDNFVCVHGQMRLVLYDPRPGSKTRGQINEFMLNLEEPILVNIPKSVYHGFKNVGAVEAIVINIVTVPYSKENPDEYRVDPYNNDIDYDWSK